MRGNESISDTLSEALRKHLDEHGIEHEDWAPWSTSWEIGDTSDKGGEGK